MKILTKEVERYATKMLIRYDSFKEYCELNPINEEEGISSANREAARLQMLEGNYDIPRLIVNNKHPERKQTLEGIDDFLERFKVGEFSVDMSDPWLKYVSKVVNKFCNKVEKAQKATRGSKLRFG
jgi:hypothetical protein